MSDSKKAASSSELELDTSNSRNSVWLVKVPKYISSRWEKSKSDLPVATLKIGKSPGKKPLVSLSLTEEAVRLESDLIPKDYKMLVTPIQNQSLGDFYEYRRDRKEDFLSDGAKICMAGKVMQRLECQAATSVEYMTLKKNAILEAAKPARMTQPLERAIVNPKPVSAHKELIEYDKRKKAEGKKLRDDKNVVTDKLFKAFGQHQYYNLRDLVKLTNQPVTYLKEILNEYCVYNTKAPHKNMWQLKKEYSNYTASDE
ncbi:general transcription factor IIF subunit 2-like [Artemia franciscana]|uniref:General transcription factor IIF subunit 2 n=1 Tax=Artemia franciscana TaxID=6661 RepID=A0AA88I2Z0_ARTSF|nr:hypothetical protein QYM36_004534 [Artemia franciscana]